MNIHPFPLHQSLNHICFYVAGFLRILCHGEIYLYISIFFMRSFSYVSKMENFTSFLGKYRWIKHKKYFLKRIKVKKDENVKVYFTSEFPDIFLNKIRFFLPSEMSWQNQDIHNVSKISDHFEMYPSSYLVKRFFYCSLIPNNIEWFWWRFKDI